ncbi:MAG: hypothetical protein CUN57_02470 [Phototrophicales bacterium]|nr:MAG: hypothetical protein CUN57_02470 [Phototrophicales bacterium]
MVANECGYAPRHLVYTMSDTHIYVNQIDGARDQASREPLPLPKLVLTPNKSVLEMTEYDIDVVGYEARPPIKYEVAV